MKVKPAVYGTQLKAPLDMSERALALPMSCLKRFLATPWLPEVVLWLTVAQTEGLPANQAQVCPPWDKAQDCISSRYSTSMH